MKKLILLALLLAGCAGGAKPPSEAVVSADKEAETDLAEAGKTRPGVAFLADKNNALWKGDRDEVLAHFKALEKAGAPAITAVGVDEIQGHPVCASFVVTLPTDPAQRKQIFALEKEFWLKVAGGNAEDAKELIAEDEGQKYLPYNLDL